MTNLERIRKELSPARNKRVKARAAHLIAEEMTLREPRRANPRPSSHSFRRQYACPRLSMP
jgi:hypothetical protein